MARTNSDPRPVSAGEQRLAGNRTLAQIRQENATEHAAGCHGNCDGGCAQRTTQRWTDSGRR